MDGHPARTLAPPLGRSAYAFDAAEWAYARALATEVRSFGLTSAIAYSLGFSFFIWLMFAKVSRFPFFNFVALGMVPLALLASRGVHAVARERMNRQARQMAASGPLLFTFSAEAFTLVQAGQPSVHLRFDACACWLLNERFAAFYPKARHPLHRPAPVIVLRQALQSETWHFFLHCAREALGSPKPLKPMKTLMRERQQAMGWQSWGSFFGRGKR